MRVARAAPRPAARRRRAARAAGSGRAAEPRDSPCARMPSLSSDSTDCRGSRLDIGSWNTIWNRRRIRRSSSPRRCAMSTPSKRTAPAVGSTRRRSPDPAWSCRTRTPPPARRSRRGAIARDTPSTAYTCPDRAVEDHAPLDREVDGDLRRPRAATRARGHRAPSSLRIRRDRVVAAQQPPAGELRGRGDLHARRNDRGHRGANAHACVQGMLSTTEPAMASSSAPRGPSSRGIDRSSPWVYGWRGVPKSRCRCARSTMRPA